MFGKTMRVCLVISLVSVAICALYTHVRVSQNVDSMHGRTTGTYSLATSGHQTTDLQSSHQLHKDFSPAIDDDDVAANMSQTEDTQKTLVVLLAFFNDDLIRFALDSILAEDDGKPFPGDVIVVQQRSKHSDVITDLIGARKKLTPDGAGVLHHLLLLSDDMFGEAWKVPHVQNITDYSKYETVCLSDGDVIMYGDWLSEVRMILNGYPEVGISQPFPSTLLIILTPRSS